MFFIIYVSAQLLPVGFQGKLIATNKAQKIPGKNGTKCFKKHFKKHVEFKLHNFAQRFSKLSNVLVSIKKKERNLLTFDENLSLL